MRRPLAIAVALAALPLCVLAQTAASHPTCPPAWSYSGSTGPEHWGDFNKVCGNGDRQSPIDIHNVKIKELPKIEFHYDPADLVVENTSRVIEVPKVHGYITVGKDRYDLVQFHFHAPSEHEIDGKRADAELHLVHQNASGDRAVVGILIRKSKKANGDLAPIVNVLPVTACHEKDAHKSLNPATLLPVDHDYYEYAGSLTTPPCDQNVRWLVLTHDIEANSSQIAALAPLKNNRPIQKSGKREITKRK